MKPAYLLKSAAAVFGLVVTLASCQKEAVQSTTATDNTTAGTTVSASSASVILAAVTNSSTLSASGKKDSIFVVNACPAGGKRDSIAASALPTAITTYLTANYAGYTFSKAFKVYNKSGSLDSYAIIINYGNKPVGLKFDASGNFVLVFEQRERKDLAGKGWHDGGHFDDRNGLQKDTLAIKSLPSAIKSYFAANYATDTLLHAVVTKDTSYIVFSTNKGLFATAFSSKLAFVKRVQLNIKSAKHVAVAQDKLLAAITNYLTTTYPGFVFDKAYSEVQGTTIEKYVVLIDANKTRYAVQFSAAGAFVKAIVIK